LLSESSILIDKIIYYNQPNFIVVDKNRKMGHVIEVAVPLTKALKKGKKEETEV
jgi:hypothetical protein